MKKLFCLIAILLFSAFLFAQNVQTSVGGVDLAATAEENALFFFRKFNQTQTKLTYMNKKGSLAKVGTETVKGDISGTIFYDVKIKGAGAIVTLRYTNYCDEAGWIYDGEIITKSNMAQNGTFSGTIIMTSPAPEKCPSLQVCYDNVILVKGAPGGGYYQIKKINDQFIHQVDYTMYLKSKESSL